MKPITLHIITGFMLVFFASQVHGQAATATARVDSTTLLIGDQVHLDLTLTVPKGSLLNWPMFADTLVRNLEILKKSGLDTVSSNASQFTLKQELVLTSFDSGYYAIPPIRFNYILKGDTTNYYAETNPVSLYVNTIATDQNEGLKPIKPPLTAPVTLREILFWLGIIFALAAIGFGIYYFFIRKKKKEPVTVTHLKPGLPPDEAALEAFEELRSKKLWQAGRVKDYYSELTDIVREYIELRFLIRAMEMTSDEIVSGLRKTNASTQAQVKLNGTLGLADLVKFAKEQPMPADNDVSLNNCIDFVKETRPSVSMTPEGASVTPPNQADPA